VSEIPQRFACDTDYWLNRLSELSSPCQNASYRKLRRSTAPFTAGTWDTWVLDNDVACLIFSLCAGLRYACHRNGIHWENMETRLWWPQIRSGCHYHVANLDSIICWFARGLPYSSDALLRSFARLTFRLRSLLRE